jgi:RNA 3'-terminal phosphate cyclase (ATP)
MNVPTGPGFVEIDGSHGEGGGQLLRTAVALSAITGRAVRVKAIRAGRERPGLQAQHLKGVEAVATLCGAKLHGANLGSTDLMFEPGSIRPQPIRIDVGTAGAVSLVLQALVLAAGRAEGKTAVELIGGTHVAWSPPMDYFKEVFCRHLKSIGVEVEVRILAHGFYPRGGGRVQVEIEGSDKWRPMESDSPGAVQSIAARSVASEELRNARVAERQMEAFKSILPAAVPEEVAYVRSLSTGSAVFGRADCASAFLGADSLGKRGVRAEDVGKEAAMKLKAEIDGGASLDMHAADMMIPYLALASQPSSFTVREMSDHLTSVQWLVRQFIDVEFESERKGNLHRISVRPR